MLIGDSTSKFELKMTSKRKPSIRRLSMQFFFLLLFFEFPSQSQALEVKKCCGVDELLDAETLHCVPQSVISAERRTHFLPSYFMNNAKTLAPLGGEAQIQNGRMISCLNYEILDLTRPLEYLLNYGGKLGNFKFFEKFCAILTKIFFFSQHSWKIFARF